MGTSKSYITPTKQHWSDAKRAATQLSKQNSLPNKERLISRYATAMKKDYNETNTNTISAIGQLLRLSQSISNIGVEQTLKDIDKEYLLEKNPEEILNILINEYCQQGDTINNYIEMYTLSLALKELNIVTLEDLKTIPVDILLKEIIINYINQNFKFRFEEKIGKKNSPENTNRIIEEMGMLMRNKLIEELDISQIKNIDFFNLENDKLIQEKIIEAYDILRKLYGEE